jgi:hypothetical protein
VVPWGAFILVLLSWEQTKDQKSDETKLTSTDLHSRTMCNVLEGARGIPERDGKKREKRCDKKRAWQQLNRAME